MRAGNQFLPNSCKCCYFDLFPRITNILNGILLVNPFQKFFSSLCPDPPDESLRRGATASGFFDLKVETSDSSIHGLQNGCCVSRHENNIHLTVHLHQSSWVTRNVVTEQEYLKSIFFPEQQVSRVGSANCVVNRCAIAQALLFTGRANLV